MNYKRKSPEEFDAATRGFSSRLLTSAVEACCALDAVRAEVRKNYTNNLWWPVEIKDYRLRMLLAGWSTRVSYGHLKHYQSVVRAADGLGWERLVSMEDAELQALTRPIGLPRTRIEYLRSLQVLLVKWSRDDQLPTDEPNALIDLIAGEVRGASFKVAQCAALYAFGYHCGVVPIDSGMVEMLGPVVPFQLPKDGSANEIVRAWVEHGILENRAQLRRVAERHGYELSEGSETLTWWVHLVLIYYKRLYWNKRLSVGPFRRGGAPEGVAAEPLEGEESAAVDRPGAKRSVRLIVLEGVDGVGKSTIASGLEACGARILHFSHRESENLTAFYRGEIEKVDTFTVFDRSFVSELVYGDVLRGFSRISIVDCKALFDGATVPLFVLFVDASTAEIVGRRNELAGKEIVIRNLRKKYDEVREALRSSVSTYRLCPSALSKAFLLDLLVN